MGIGERGLEDMDIVEDCHVVFAYLQNAGFVRLSKKSRSCKFCALFFDLKAYWSFFFVGYLVFRHPVVAYLLITARHINQHNTIKKSKMEIWQYGLRIIKIENNGK